MKSQLICLSALCLVFALRANAQAPSSLAGDGILSSVTNGTSPFESYGYSLFLPANSGNSYQLIGIFPVDSGNGTYSYSVTDPSTALLTLNDSSRGVGTVSVNFVTSGFGTFYFTDSASPGAYQAGDFGLASNNAPSSIAGRAFVATIDDGQSPFSSAGSYTFRAAASGNTYTIVGDGTYIGNSSGTYSYSLANRSTGKLVINDVLAGSATVYVGLTDPTQGGFALTQPSTGGFQVGTFVFLDTSPPTVSITNPPGGKIYINSQIVTISANATDNVGVVSVEFYDGTALKATDTTAAYTYDWSITAADNGAHSWTARAYDAAGNSSTSSPVTLTVSIDITPPTVAVTSPTNGANLTTSPNTVSGTASDPGSPSSGLNVVELRLNGGGWTNATGTTSWGRSVTLSPCGNTIEARSLDNAGNYSTIASNFVFYTPPNTVPNTPTNISPATGVSNVSVIPTLQASAFSDPDPPCLGDTHAASQWQVLNRPGSVVVADSGTDSVDKVTWTVPAGKLYYGSNYQWQVRYRDSRNGWSSYSARTFFTNGGPWLIGVQLGTNFVLNWPTNSIGFALQSSTNLSSANWSNTTPLPVIAGGQYAVTNNLTNWLKFYRLKK